MAHPWASIGSPLARPARKERALRTVLPSADDSHSPWAQPEGSESRLEAVERTGIEPV